MRKAVIQKLVVVGAGQMGAGIAQVAAETGLEVVLSDRTQALAEGGKRSIEGHLTRAVDKGRMSREERDAALARIRAEGPLVGWEEADAAIEAASENVELKLELFRDLDRALPSGALLLSNTSSISITKLAQATSRAPDVAGMHFMNPVPLMKLCEIVRGERTSEETLNTVRELGVRLGKTMITSRDRPGFLVNRILIPLLNEACFALEEGVGSADDIDTGAKLGLGHPMGPLELADLIGLDTVLAIAEILRRDFNDEKYRPAPLLRSLVTAGTLGRKSRRGFYEYDERGKKAQAARAEWRSP